MRTGAILADGGADAILDSVRPVFDAAARTVEQSLQLVNLDQDAATFINEADPDALAAYQALKPAVAVIERVLGLAAKFGLRSITFPLISKPSVAGSIPFEHLNGIKDEALFTTDPAAGGGGLASTMRAYNDHAAALASQRTLNPQRMGMRAGLGPHVHGGLRLNTIDEARDMRSWAEAMTDNAITSDLAG